MAFWKTIGDIILFRWIWNSLNGTSDSTHCDCSHSHRSTYGNYSSHCDDLDDFNHDYGFDSHFDDIGIGDFSGDDFDDW
ncbi:MAG: hypothetical protein K2H84_04965 [Paramuribaculum sp.]|nr:hypothetical protein [Paramuribaculum sp.]